LYKIDDFGSIFELTADMSFPPGGWSAITLGGGRSIQLSYGNIFNFAVAGKLYDTIFSYESQGRP
jgi:hypothetical protein